MANRKRRKSGNPQPAGRVQTSGRVQPAGTQQPSVKSRAARRRQPRWVAVLIGILALSMVLTMVVQLTTAF